MAGAGRVRLHRARALRLFLCLEPPAVRRACSTCSRLHWGPLAALRVDEATVERAFEPTGSPRAAADCDGKAVPQDGQRLRYWVAAYHGLPDL